MSNLHIFFLLFLRLASIFLHPPSDSPVHFPSWTESSLDWVVLLVFGYQCFCQFTQRIQEGFVWMALKLFIHNSRIYNAQHETSIEKLLPPFQRLSFQIIEAYNLIGKVNATQNLSIELYCFWARYHLPLPSLLFSCIGLELSL